MKRQHKWLNSGNSSNGILSVEEFRTVIDHERCRCDRCGEHFAVIVLKARHRATIDTFHRHFVKALENRKRCIDEIGIVSNRGIGLLLPATDAAGATQLAHQLLHSTGADLTPPLCRVYTYPAQPPPFDSDASLNREQVELERHDEATCGAEVSGDDLDDLLAVDPPAWKRTLDICAAATGLSVLAPLILAIAVYIRLVSKGPVLFRQERVGYMGRTFTCLKFRTMHQHSDSTKHREYFQSLIESEQKMTKLESTSDPRIIPLGELLRQTGLDELPQLINVLRGEMSLIGPRPCIPYEYRHYRPWQQQRVSARPGLTGLWQVSGKNRTTFNEMMRYDITYERKKSLMMDIAIVFKTIPAIIQQISDNSQSRRRA